MNSDMCGDAESNPISKEKQVKKVQILMSTYNGEDYIREQLDSILAQSYPDVDILIRDDGSKDDTFVILKVRKRIVTFSFSFGSTGLL